MAIPVHPDGTIDAQPCVKCGEITLSILEIETAQSVVSELFMCRECRDPLLAGAAINRETFERLLAMGATRSEANRIMIKRIDRKGKG